MIRIICFTLAFLKVGIAFASPQVVANWDEADQHVGETATICGPAAFAGRIALTDNSAAIILGGGLVDRATGFKDESRFKVVFLDYHDEFEQDLASYYLGKETCVVGTILWAMAGGVEILPTNSSQVSLKSDGMPSMPAGNVSLLPRDAVSYMNARDYVGQSKVVCGIVVAARQSVPPNQTLNKDFQLPAKVAEQYPEGVNLWPDDRVRHRLTLGDFSRMEVFIPVGLSSGLPRDISEYFLNKEICVSGQLEHTPQAGAGITVEDLSSIKFLN